MSIPRGYKSSATKQDSIKEARQKKLQIDGENLLKKINATISKPVIPQDDLSHIRNIKLDDDLKKYKYSLEAIELLFLNINENMNEDDVKLKNFEKLQTDILRLETSINNLRESLRTEMLIIKESEATLSDDPNLLDPESESDESISENRKRVGSKHEMNLNSIKNIINCPFKSQEVQEYLNFTKCNKKLGGWNDVYHNVFVQLWNKNIGRINNFNYDDTDIFESTSFMRFTKEIQLRIKGLTTEDLMDHSKWFIKYLFFRSRQQQAIDKYKEEKRLKIPPLPVKNPPPPVKNPPAAVKNPPPTVKNPPPPVKNPPPPVKNPPPPVKNPVPPVNPPPTVSGNNIKTVKTGKSKQELPSVTTSKTNTITTKVNVVSDMDSLDSSDWSDEEFEP